MTRTERITERVLIASTLAVGGGSFKGSEERWLGAPGWSRPLAALLSAVVALLAALSAAPPPRAAEAVKLRHAGSIYVDAKGSPLRLPEGVASDGKSLVVVADTGNGRLLTYAVNEKAVTPKAEIVLPQLPVPVRVRIDPRGDILALDGKLRRIARIGPDGIFKAYVDPASGPPGGTMVPRSFDIDARGALYVLDIRGGRIVVIGPGGEIEREIAFPERYGFVSDLAVDRRGTVYAVDSVLRRVYAAPKDGRALAPLGESLVKEASFPASIAADDRGWIYVADRNDGGIVLLGMDGSFRGRQLASGWGEGFLRYCGQIAIDAGAGTLLVADRENDRVQIFSIAP